MGVDWAAIRPVLIEVVTRCAVDQIKAPASPPEEPLPFFDLNHPEFSADWRERRQPAIQTNQEVQVDLKITTVSTVGNDDWRYTMQEVEGSDPPTQDLFQSIEGLRRVVCQIKATTMQEEDSFWAVGVLERVRTRLDWNSSRQALLAVGVDYTDCLAVNDTTFTDDGRRVSAATLDVVFTMVSNDTDPIPIGWIERIIHTSHIKDPGGTELPRPPNVVNEVLPPFAFGLGTLGDLILGEEPFPGDELPYAGDD